MVEQGARVLILCKISGTTEIMSNTKTLLLETVPPELAELLLLVALFFAEQTGRFTSYNAHFKC